MVRTSQLGIFPTPVFRAGDFLSQDIIDACTALALNAERERNFRSEGLSHTTIVEPAAEPAYAPLIKAVMPHVRTFGEMLFAEFMDWQIKEIWTNVLETGGYQPIHTHANSFISGVVYLSSVHPSASTVFHREIGGREFIFSNQNSRAKPSKYNGNKWVCPAPKVGDLLLFPSYLLHEVPVNEGGRRLTTSFNALPERLDSFGYQVEFSSRRVTEGE